ncbi:hypothetical protein PIPA1_43220 [Pelosinus sp. IPA-1]|nr:hypothetical protein PIPA1_43220 [Pelosinus sp. IPA-1]
MKKEVRKSCRILFNIKLIYKLINGNNSSILIGIKWYLMGLCHTLEYGNKEAEYPAGRLKIFLYHK